MDIKLVERAMRFLDDSVAAINQPLQVGRVGIVLTSDVILVDGDDARSLYQANLITLLRLSRALHEHRRVFVMDARRLRASMDHFQLVDRALEPLPISFERLLSRVPTEDIESASHIVLLGNRPSQKQAGELARQIAMSPTGYADEATILFMGQLDNGEADIALYSVANEPGQSYGDTCASMLPRAKKDTNL